MDTTSHPHKALVGIKSSVPRKQGDLDDAVGRNLHSRDTELMEYLDSKEDPVT